MLTDLTDFNQPLHAISIDHTRMAYKFKEQDEPYLYAFIAVVLDEKTVFVKGLSEPYDMIEKRVLTVVRIDDTLEENAVPEQLWLSPSGWGRYDRQKEEIEGFESKAIYFTIETAMSRNRQYRWAVPILTDHSDLNPREMEIVERMRRDLQTRGENYQKYVEAREESFRSVGLSERYPTPYLASKETTEPVEADKKPLSPLGWSLLRASLWFYLVANVLLVIGACIGTGIWATLCIAASGSTLVSAVQWNLEVLRSDKYR